MTNNNLTGYIRTYQDSCMSLSCDGKVTFENGIITNVNFKGYPRSEGDGWAGFYMVAKIGDYISIDTIKWLLRYHNQYNVISKYEGNIDVENSKDN